MRVLSTDARLADATLDEPHASPVLVEVGVTRDLEASPAAATTLRRDRLDS